MHGGTRSGAGRKTMSVKKQPVTIYLDDVDRDIIMQMPLPQAHSFSQKCKILIDRGISRLHEELRPKQDEITFIDLFCGLGGIRLGFESALKQYARTGKCVFSSDVKKPAVKAYQHYFDENPMCDITKIDPARLPNFDFLLAGFPCQAFSQAGTRLGFQDTRGTLFFNVAAILREKKPQGFVLENVEGLVSHDKGKTFEIILNTLTELGYNVQYRVLNGKDFGLAQSRSRIYIIGLKGKTIAPLDGFAKKTALLKDIIETAVPPTHTNFTKKLLSHFTLEETYGKAIKDKRGGDNNIHSWDIGLKGNVSEAQKDLLGKLLKHRRNKKWAQHIGIDWMDGMPLPERLIFTFYPHPYLHELLEDLVQKGYLTFEHPKRKVGNRRIADPALEKGYNIVTGKLSFEYSKVLSPYEVTPTLVATDVQKLAVPVGGGIRTLTTNEGLRLFGFPEDYTLDFLTEREAFDLLDNTVCIPVIKAVSERLLSAYFN